MTGVMTVYAMAVVLTSYFDAPAKCVDVNLYLNLNLEITNRIKKLLPNEYLDYREQPWLNQVKKCKTESKT